MEGTSACDKTPMFERGGAADSLLMISYSWEGFITTGDRLFLSLELLRSERETLQTEWKKIGGGSLGYALFTI